MLLPALFPGLLLACQTPCSAPAMTNLKSSYSYGEQLAMDVAQPPSGTTIGFTAEGAVITFLQMPGSPWSTAPTLIEKFPVPEMQPLAIKYFHKSTTNQDWLIIAGGSQGLWAVQLCAGLFQNPPVACGSYTRDQLDIVGTGSPYFNFKRCQAIAIDMQSAVMGGPVLYALFSASSESSDWDVSVGATELRAYDLGAAAPFPLIASITIPSPPTNPTRSQKGTALAVDPGSHDTVFLATGKGGIWQAGLGPGPAHLFVVGTNPMWIPPSPIITNISDLAVSRLTIQGVSHAFLYAALNYGVGTTSGSVLEYEITGTHATQTVSVPPGYSPVRLAASASGSSVFIAVGAGATPSRTSEAAAPYTVNGFWFGPCLDVGAPDPDDPNYSLLPGATDQALVLIERDSSGSLNSRLTVSLPNLAKGVWNAIWMPPVISSSSFPVFANSTWYGTQVAPINSATQPWTGSVSASYIGKAFGATDATVSLINPGVVRFGYESAGTVEYDGFLGYIDPQSPYSISLIAGTTSECPNGGMAPSCCGTITDPGAYGGGIMGEAHWVEPGTNREWFLPGRPYKARFSDAIPNCGGLCVAGESHSCSNCTTIFDCTTPWNPCNSSGSYLPNVHWRSDASPLGYPAEDNGIWQLSAHTLPGIGMMPLASTIDPRWENIVIPLVAAVFPNPQESRGHIGYCHSIVDPRMTSQGYPTAVYAVRGATSYGLQVFKPDQLTTQAQITPGCPTNPWGGGFGEMLPSTAITYRQVLTRIELQEDTGISQCVPGCACISPVTPHHYSQNRADIARTRTQFGASAYVIVVAAGLAMGVQAASTPPPPCLWSSYNNLPMIVAYDITKTGDGTFLPPTLLRVGIGEAGYPGNAFAVKIKTYGSGSTARNYAFVADITGRLLVFDVTGDQLYPTPAPGQGYLPTGPVLAPLTGATLPFPKDPYDGYPANCIDLELDGNYLYCALGRAGVGIVDVSIPAQPTLCNVLDTPGIVEGLAIRTTGPLNPHKQLIVCDTRCGIRLYEQ